MAVRCQNWAYLCKVCYLNIIKILDQINGSSTCSIDRESFYHLYKFLVELKMYYQLLPGWLALYSSHHSWWPLVAHFSKLQNNFYWAGDVAASDAQAGKALALVYGLVEGESRRKSCKFSCKITRSATQIKWKKKTKVKLPDTVKKILNFK